MQKPFDSGADDQKIYKPAPIFEILMALAFGAILILGVYVGR